MLKRPKTLQVIKNDHKSFDFIEPSNFSCKLFTITRPHIDSIFEEIQELALSASSGLLPNPFVLRPRIETDAVVYRTRA